MDIKIISSTRANCKDYLKLLYEDKEYSIMEFANKYKEDDFSLDLKLKECNILYRGKKMTYNELNKKISDFSKSLKFSKVYKKIYPIEHLLLCSNKDYYKASKYIKKVEKCLQTARYYLLISHDLLKTDFEVNWCTGYGPIFLFRTMNFTTAVLWYNSCFDYILQVIYFAFEIYKKFKDYTDDDSHEALLKRCNYYEMGKIYNQYKHVSNYKELWDIINKCYNNLSDVNKWANYIKHKGGISFIGLNPPEPFNIILKDTEGNVTGQSNDFEAINIDLDDSYNVLKSAHIALYNCIDELFDFINFNGALPKNEGTLIPDKSSYVKVILP